MKRILSIIICVITLLSFSSCKKLIGGELNNTNSDSRKQTISQSGTQEEADLSTNYEVPDFDAEKYFKDNTTVIDSFSVVSSKDLRTEKDAYNDFYNRGFKDMPITYDYAIDGDYLGETEISNNSLNKHPMYQIYYVTKKNLVWIISQVNGTFFATPVSYNLSKEVKPQTIVSETNTVISYDSATNQFYVNIPDKTRTVVKTIKVIDAKTIESLTFKELDKLQ